MFRVVVFIIGIITSINANANWFINESTDEITDITSKVALSNDSLIGSNCDSFLFRFNKHMNSDGELAFITIRIDKNTPTFAVGEWLNNYAMISVESLKDRKIFDQMKAGSKIIYQAENYKGYKTTQSQSLIGFTKTMKNLGCKKTISLTRKAEAARKEAERKVAEASEARELHRQDEVSRYAAIYTQMIQQNLLVEQSYFGKECLLTIRLSANGLLLDASEAGGDKYLCRAAKGAVVKVSQFPVPDDPMVVEELRTVNLTIKAQ